MKKNSGGDYGYQWHLYSDTHQAARLVEVNDIYYAAGAGNQFIWIIPHLDLVIVSTASNFGDGKKSHSMLWDYILPAVK